MASTSIKNKIDITIPKSSFQFIFKYELSNFGKISDAENIFFFKTSNEQLYF